MLLDETETPLVLVRPDDRAESVLERARAAGAPRVQLLVPEGASALQRPEEVARLRDLAAAAAIELALIISSDPAALEAARLGGVPSVAVSGARVVAPPCPGATSPAARKPASPYSTRVLEEAPTPPAGSPARADASFLAALDDLDAAPRSGPAAARDEEAAAAASLAAALSEPGPRRMSDTELLRAGLAAEPGMTPPRVAGPAAPPAEPRRAPGPIEGPPPEGPGRARRPRPAAARPPAAPARSAWPIVALTVALLALLAVIGAVLLWGSRVTVSVTPPQRPDTVEPIAALPVPLAQPGSDAPTAVEAESVRSEVAFTVEGEVTEVTLTPAGSAEGSLTIFNSNAQAVPLPAGTEFIAVGPGGQEVPFVSTVDVVVPGATTSDTGAQIITSRGQASVPVTARSPGSGSNVEGNSVRRVIPPGGAPFNADGGSFIVQHPPLTGGSEEEVRIVKDSNVRELLGPALEGLDAEARLQLDGLAAARGLTIDPTTLRPRRAELEQLQGFDYT
ncbi:MAG TPA: hypothetical protein PKD53_17385, partial [Chloroflexaceae bacterium]|nr:hypothetical protein [Chloroflexaceae bacterium]